MPRTKNGYSACHFIKPENFHFLDSLEFYLCPGINIFGNIYNIGTPLAPRLRTFESLVNFDINFLPRVNRVNRVNRKVCYSSVPLYGVPI